MIGTPVMKGLIFNRPKASEYYPDLKQNSKATPLVASQNVTLFST